MAEASQAPPEGEALVEEKKKRGKPKDPHAPPKPKNPFSKFSSEARVRLKEQRPELLTDLSAMGKALAEEWQKVPEADKERSQAEYEKEMLIWKPKWAAYKQTKQYKDFVEVKTDWLDKRAQKKLVKTMNKDAPKRPKSGYMIYASEIREEILEKVKAEGLGLGDAGRMTAERWAELSETKKASYDEQSQKQKIAFDKDFGEYKKTEAYSKFMTEKVKLETLQKLKKSQRVNLDGAPKKPPSGFGLYRNEVMPELAKENEGKKEGEKLTCGDLTKKIGDMWGKLAEEKKAEYNTTADKARAEWEKAYRSFKTDKKYRDFLESRKNLKERENKMVNLREMPKKPKSVFAMFAEEHKKEVEPGRGEGKGNSALKQKFANASEEEKKKLEEKRKELEDSWTKEVEEYKSSVKYATFENTQKKIEQEFKNEAIKVTTLKFLSAAPKAPPKSAFAVFLGEKRKADADAGDEKKDKKAKTEEVKKYQDEFLKLAKESKAEYEAKQKEKLKAYEEEVREFMKGDMWQEYQKEAKRMKIPIKSLMLHKQQIIKSLRDKDGKLNISAIPLPEKPDSYPLKPRSAMKLFMESKKGEGAETAAITESWNKLTAEEKKEWDTKAEEDAKRFAEALDLFNKSDEGAKYLKEYAIADRRRKTVLAKDKYLKDQPQKPLVAFMEFVKKTKGKVKKEFPDLKGHELEKKIKDMWTGLPDDEKTELEKAAKEKMDEYEEKMAAFKKSDNWKKYTMMTRVKVGKFGQRLGKAKAKAKAKPQGVSAIALPQKPDSFPSRPRNAMKLFIDSKKGEDVKLDSIMESWKSLTAEEKQGWETKAAEDSKRYEEAVAAFNKSEEGVKYLKELAIATRRRKMFLAKDKYLKELPQKPAAAFVEFVKENRGKVKKEFPDLKGNELEKKMKDMWTELAADEKAALEKAAEEKMNEYREKLETFQKGENWRKYTLMTKVRMGKFGKRLGKAKAKVKAKAKGGGSAMPSRPESYPQKPMGIFECFAKEEKDAGRSASLTDMQKRFSALPEDEKKRRVAESNERREKFRNELEAWEKSKDGRMYRLKILSFTKQKKMKSLKDRFMKDEPKRPTGGAFFIYLNANRAKIAAENPDCKGVGEVTKKCSEVWKSLSDSDRLPWLEKEREAMAEYEKKLEAFKAGENFKRFQKMSASVQNMGKPKGKAKSKGKGFAAPPPPDNLPKPPRSAMTLYGDKCRAEGGGSKTIRETAMNWMKLGAEGQKPYKEQEEALKKKYEEEMIAFRKTAEGKKYLRLKSDAEKKQKLAAAKQKFLAGDNAPTEPKRPASAFFMFLSERGSSVQEADKAKRAKTLTDMWSGLSAEEKKKFEDKHAAAKAKYEEDMKAFKSSKGFKDYEKTLNRLSGKNEQKKKAQEMAKQREAAKKEKADAKAAALAARAAAKAARAPAKRAAAKPASAPPAKKAASGSSAMGSDSKSSKSSSSSSSSKSSGSD